MPFLESKIVTMLRATGGANGGMTAEELSRLVFAPIGRVRMTLRRLHDKGEVRITSGHGPSARYLPSDVAAQRPEATSIPADHRQGELELRRLRAEVQQLRIELSRARQDAEAMRQLLRGRPARPAEAGQLLGTQIDVLLQLCHPDRHDNSDKANEITRWLLQLRSRPKLL